MSQSKEEVSRLQRKNILNLLVLMLLVAAALIFLQSFVIPYYVNSYISQFLPIKKLDFQQNRWITINDANIFHVHRLGSVHPSEELTVELRITNPTNETLGYHPQVSVIGGNNDKRDYQEYSTWWVQPYQKDSISLPFFAGNEGDNEIKVSLHVRDINGNKFPDEFTNSTAIFGVLSTVELLENQNSTLQNSLIVSSIIGALTFTALALTWYTSRDHVRELREQNKIYQEQFKLQNRPWITFPEPMPIFVALQDHSIPYEDYSRDPGKYIQPISEIRFSIDVTNIGTMPSKKISYRILERSEKITRDFLISNGDTGNSFPMIPQEKVAFKFSVPAKYWNTKKDIFYYFGLYLEYETVQGKTGKIGKIWGVQAGGTSQEDYWIDDELLK